MALLWYSSYWKLMPFNMGFLYNVSLGLRGTSDFSLLPLKACAVTIAQWLVLPFLLSHNFFLLVRPSWKSLTDFLFQDPLGLLILAIWPFSPFQLFGALHPCHFSQIVGIFYCWVESSLPATSTYDFLILGSLWYSSFVHEGFLYTFWFLTAWLGAWDPFVLRSHFDLI